MLRISVGVPVYNTARRYLEECIESILNQSYKPYEIFVVNDGSDREETLRYIEILQNRNDITVIHQSNKGISGALNAGIRRMSGEWWGALSSDDKWYPTKLERQVEFIEKNPRARVVHSDHNIIDANGDIISEKGLEYSFKTLEEQQRHLMGSYFGMWSTMLVHREVFDTVGIYNEEFIAVEDYEMAIRISQYYLYYHIPEVLVSYRYHPEQTTNTEYGFQNEIGRKYDERARQLAHRLFGGTVSATPP